MNAARLRWLVHGAGAIAALAVQALLWSAQSAFAPRALVGDEHRYLSEALAIWQGHPPAPDYIWPPLQSWFLALLSGPLDGRLWLVQAVQMLLLVAAAWLLRRIWLHLDPRPLAADLAFWLMLCSPALMAYGFYLWPEPLHLCLMLAAMLLLLTRPGSVWTAAGAGIALALALLSKSLLSGFWPLFLLLLVRWPLRRSHWRAMAAFTLALLAVTGPFLVRGWQATGKPLIADSSVYNLYVGLNDGWRSDYILDRGGSYMHEYLASGPTPAARNAAFMQRVEQTLQARGLAGTLGERLGIQYFRLFSAKRTLLSQLPGPRCAGYLGAYTLPAHWVLAVQVLTRAHYLLMLALAAFALAWWRRPSRLLALIGLFTGYQLALFLFLHVQARFLLPMLPFLTGFAASGLAVLLPSGQAGAPLATTRWRTAAAVLLAACLVFLACAGPWLDQSCARA